ncbi:MAG: LLM class flavin-dependent oxidoreductase, partial [Pandoraea sp.]|nr:LLM class flavin-dependent oxidoreductase [Pandoraea sp.]
LFNDTLADDHPYRDVLLQPAVATRPELWVLGSSEFGGLLAAQLGLRYCFAHFINAHDGHRVTQAYRERFTPGAPRKPYCAVALFVICADTDAEAEALEAGVDLRRVQMAYGMNEPIPSLEQGAQAMAQYRERELSVIAREKPRSIIGTPERVTERVLALQEQFEADEIVVLTVAGSYRARLRSHELLAQAFSLRSAD